MKFEKVNENKIRIKLSVEDLQEKDIDFHSFMSNSIESQDLFLDMLEEAEKEVGFVTKNYQIRIEALALADGDFILTVTRISPNTEKEKSIVKPSKKKVQIHRKKNIVSSHVLYCFPSFDDFCEFGNFLHNHHFSFYPYLAKQITLYSYHQKYYLILTNLNSDHPNLKKFYSSITEFGVFVNNSDIFIPKIIENGTLIMKHNAIRTCIQYFIKSKKR